MNNVEIIERRSVVEIIGGPSILGKPTVEFVEIIGTGPQGPAGDTSDAGDFDPGDLAALFLAS